MQRRIRQHHPQPGRGAEPALPRRVFLFQQQDGAAGAFQQFGLLPADPAPAGRGGLVPGHQGQGLFGAVLAAPQPGHRLGAVGPAGQVDAAGALHRDDPPRRQGLLGQGDGVALLLGPCGVQVERPGPADRAAVGLGVVPAAADVFVFGVAGGAHPEPGHGGGGAVIGQATDDGKPGPAVGAVDEGVAVPPALWVLHLFQAGFAGGQVGGNQCGGLAPGAGPDHKPPLPGGGFFFYMDGLHHRQGRRGGAQRLPKGIQGGGGAFQLQFQPGGGVPGPARKAEPGRQPVDVRPEPHPLDDAFDEKMAPDHASAARASRTLAATWAASSSRPSPVRLETWNRGPSGLTPL